MSNLTFFREVGEDGIERDRKRAQTSSLSIIGAMIEERKPLEVIEQEMSYYADNLNWIIYDAWVGLTQRYAVEYSRYEKDLADYYSLPSEERENPPEAPENAPELSFTPHTVNSVKGMFKEALEGLEKLQGKNILGYTVALNAENQNGLTAIASVIPVLSNADSELFPLSFKARTFEGYEDILFTDSSSFQEFYRQFILSRQQYFN